MTDNLEPKLREFRLKKMGNFADETLLRASRRIQRFHNLGYDVFNVNEQWAFEYCAAELKEGKMRKSLRSDMEDLIKWCDFTGQKDVIPKLPHFKKEPDPDPIFPTTEEYERILRTTELKQKEQIRDYKRQKEHEAKWARIECEVRILAEGGLRASEFVRLNLADVREKGFMVRSAKREKDRLVAVSPKTLRKTEEYIKNYRLDTDRKALFTLEYGRIKKQVLQQEIKEAGKVSNVPKLHPHALRHFCATRLLKAGLNLRKIQIHLGHKDIQSTQRYTHMLDSEVQDEVFDYYSGRSVRVPGFFREGEVMAI
jgi:site-specific recombinase XerD